MINSTSAKAKKSCALCWALALFLSGSVWAEDAAYWQPIGALIQRGDYRTALQEAERLLAERADDSTLLRVKGICLLELNREDEAVAVLRRAVKLAPGSVAAQFYLAQALAYQGGVVEAGELLRAVQSAAPDSEYARRAAAVLPDLENLQSARQASPGQKRWDLTMRLAGEYDDNVPARSRHDPKRSRADSFRMVAALDVEFRPLDQKLDSTPLTLGTGYSLYQSFHERGGFHAYDLTSQGARLYLQHAGQIRTMPFKARLTGQYSNDRLDGHAFSESGGLRAGLELQWADQAVLTTTYSADWRNFKNDGKPPSLFSRDGLEQAIGFEQYFYTCHNKLVLSVGYTYQWADTEGRQFHLASHRVNGSATVALPWKWSWVNSLSYATEDYLDYTPTPRRADDVLTLSIVLSRPLWNPNVTLDLNFSRTVSFSNNNNADYERNIVGLGLSYHL